MSNAQTNSAKPIDKLVSEKYSFVAIVQQNVPMPIHNPMVT